MRKRGESERKQKGERKRDTHLDKQVDDELSELGAVRRQDDGVNFDWHAGQNTVDARDLGPSTHPLSRPSHAPWHPARILALQGMTDWRAAFLTDTCQNGAAISVTDLGVPPTLHGAPGAC